MERLKIVLKNTFKNAYKTIKFVLKIIIPVTFIVVLLQYLDFIKYITFVFEPLMKFFGLPGDAALVLITSNLINIYGGLAVMGSLSFTVKEVTILSVMILFSHSLIIEGAIIKALNISIKKQLLIRLSAAILSGILLNLLIGNHYGESAYSTLETTIEIPELSVDNFFVWGESLLIHYFTSIFKTSITIIWIITCVLFGLEILKEFKLLDQLNHFIYYLTKHLGLSKSANSSLIVGFFIGITYGAGAILVHYKEGKMSKKDVMLVTTFLLLCHAIVEDVLLFINHGAIPWILIPYKITFATLVTYFFNWSLKRKEKKLNALSNHFTIQTTTL